MASGGMSSRRSRSGGRWISIVLRRKSRSWRNRPGGDFFVQVGIGGGDHAHVHAPRLRRADALELARLQHAQQLRLQVQRHVGDLVEKQRSAIGELEAAHAVDLGVGERAADMAEQFALENAFGESARVHRDHRLPARSEAACRACAITPLPDPFSPVIRTCAREGPTRETTSSTERMAGDSAIRLGRF